MNNTPENCEQYIPQNLKEKLYVSECQRHVLHCESLLNDIKQCLNAYYLKKIKKEEFTEQDYDLFRKAASGLMDILVPIIGTKDINGN